MTAQSDGKLNRLERLLPEGLLTDAAWLSAHGYQSSLRSQYVAGGWLEQPARRVYRRSRGTLNWQQAVLSLQLLLGHRLAVGGRTALELQGYAHYLSAGYLSAGPAAVYLYGPARPPGWLTTLPVPESFLYRHSVPLLGEDKDLDAAFPSLPEDNAPPPASGPALESAGLRVLPWGQWDWPMVLSTPERAVLELLDELPGAESFHQVDMLMEGLSDLSPRRLQALLGRCRSVKVKRLFFFFADRHNHAWLRHIDRSTIDLGAGKRMLVKDGRFDPAYRITVPRDLTETV